MEMGRASPGIGADLESVRCAFMRGGSSRGGVFLEQDLPADPSERAAVLLACYGSPDVRQIDGIGGGDPLTSKAAVVGRSLRTDADVEYTFYQVGIDRPSVSTGGSCGNMLSAVGPFAILKGLVPPTEPLTTVRVYTTNTRQVVTVHIPVRDGLPLSEGGCSVAGVPDQGAPIQLDFGDCSGAVSGKLLPSGAAHDVIRIGDRSLTVSLIDAATPFVFVNARDAGASGYESPEEIKANADLMALLENIRGWAAVTLGLVERTEEAADKSPNIPRVMMVATPGDYRTLNGQSIAATDVDICVRQLAMQRPHRALAVTGAVCAAVASAVPGSVVANIVGTKSAAVRLGHPSGVLRVASRTRLKDGELHVESARIDRTARLIMDGQLYFRRSKANQLFRSLQGHHG